MRIKEIEKLPHFLSFFFTQIYSHVHLLSYLAEKLEINIKSDLFFLKPKPNIFIHLEKESPNTNPQGMEVETPPSKKISSFMDLANLAKECVTELASRLTQLKECATDQIGIGSRGNQ